MTSLWIESHVDLRTHPKTIRFARKLGVDRASAIGWLHLLWWWAIEHAETGDLNDRDPEYIADAIEWAGDPQAFWDALVYAGFVKDGLIHDWDAYAGKLLRRKEADRLRKSTGRPPDNHRTSGGTRDISGGVPVEGDRNPADSGTFRRNLDRNRNRDLTGTGLPVAGAADAGQPPKITRPKMIKSSGDQKAETVKPAPKPNRVAEVIEALRALNPDAPSHISARDGAAIKQSGANPALIAEAFNAAYTGEWGDTWMQDNLSLQLVITRLPGYETHVKAPPKPKGGQTAVNVNGNREAQERRYGGPEQVQREKERWLARRATDEGTTMTTVTTPIARDS